MRGGASHANPERHSVANGAHTSAEGINCSREERNQEVMSLLTSVQSLAYVLLSDVSHHGVVSVLWTSGVADPLDG
jgi:hypothetical protein